MNRTTITILLIIACTGALWSEAMTLDRKTSVELALENNPDFKISGISLETAAREERNVWNEFLPSITAGAGLSGGTPFLDEQPNDLSWNFSASFDMSLPLNAGLAYSIKGIRLAYESEEITYNTARQNLIAEVEKEFYYLVASQTNIAIKKANLELAMKRYEQALTNFRNGFASELSVLQSEVSAKNLEPTYLQAVATFEARVREFLIILGLDPDTDVEWDGSLETPDLDLDVDDLITRYLSQRQDIQALTKYIEIVENSRKTTVSNSRTPTMQLSAGWATQVGDPFNAGAWNYETWTDGLSLGLSLSVPLDGFIPGSATDVSIKSVDDTIEKAHIQLAKATDEARTEIINLVAQLETSAANMELSSLNVDLAKRSYEMSEESFNRGTLQRLDVEDAQQSYLSANQQYLLSQYEYLSGLIDLRTALGLDSLEELL